MAVQAFLKQLKGRADRKHIHVFVLTKPVDEEAMQKFLRNFFEHLSKGKSICKAFRDSIEELSEEFESYKTLKEKREEREVRYITRF